MAPPRCKGCLWEAAFAYGGFDLPSLASNGKRNDEDTLKKIKGSDSISCMAVTFVYLFMSLLVINLLKEPPALSSVFLAS